MASLKETATCSLFLSFLLSSVSAWFVVETNTIRVMSPNHLRHKYDAAIGDFGLPKYGASMLGSLVYPKNNSLGCEKFEGNKLFKSELQYPTFALLDRGECFFVLKAWNAQQAGAAAVLVADNVDEPLLTMVSPDESNAADAYVENITIPSALINRTLGEILKQALKNESVVIKLDWTESVPHPDQRVEYELWTNSNDECGANCEEQMNFIKNFKGRAQILEKGGYTLFRPHCITWYCPPEFTSSSECQSECINNGRYCAPDPEQDLSAGYEGKDVVFENLRQLCVYRVANEGNRSWVWWDYVTDFHIRCSMKEKKYSKDCAEEVMKSLGLPIDKIRKCVGDPEADADNEVLKTEQDLQVGQGSRGDITMVPTLVINDAQYRGKLESNAVLEAICAGFKEATEPRICLSRDLETNECQERNGGCWRDTKTNITACKDTFRGRICECPTVNGVQFRGDGYTSCKPYGPGRCAMNDGGCWAETRDGLTFSACSRSKLSGCQCPAGFRGDGYQCEDIDECKERLACQCDNCKCKNTWGGHHCKCTWGHVYIKEQNTCIERGIAKFWKLLIVIIVAVIGAAGLAGYIFYKYRFRSYMDAEIVSIMSQYMPIDNQSKMRDDETEARNLPSLHSA